MTFDPTKPVRTRDGRAVRILATNKAGSEYPIVALVMGADGKERADSFTASGRCYDDGVSSRSDLFNVPETTTKYLNVYPSGSRGSVHTYNNEDAAFTRKTVEAANGIALVVTYENDKPVSVAFRD